MGRGRAGGGGGCRAAIDVMSNGRFDQGRGEKRQCVLQRVRNDFIVHRVLFSSFVTFAASRNRRLRHAESRCQSRKRKNADGANGIYCFLSRKHSEEK